MSRLTITISEDQDDFLESISGGDEEYASKSEAVRNFINHGEDTEELRREIDRLRREKQMILKQCEENTELVRYAETERERRERERERRQHNVFRRAWWVAGEPSNDA